MNLNEVSNILWRERRLLELLVFKLAEEELVLVSGNTRWLPHATREVEAVLSEIKRLELDRAVHVDALAVDLHVGSSPTLRDLVERAPSPWDAIFDDHRAALLEAAKEIDANVDTDTPTQGLSHLEHSDPTKALVELQIQQGAYELALAATPRTIQPSLVDFLR